jgi:hypothetical protein
MKILFHCDPGYSYLAREVIRRSRGKGVPIEWGVILYSNVTGLLDELRLIAGSENICYLQEGLNEYMKREEPELDMLESFPSSVFQCVSTSQVHKGHIPLVKQDRQYQLKLICGTYRIYKEFLLRNRPDAVFFPLIDRYDCFILYYLCRELGIEPVIYAHSRNLQVSYFTDSIYEELPPYARKAEVSVGNMKRAEAFIDSFRRNFKPPQMACYEPSRREIIDTSYLRPGLFSKGMGFLGRRMRQMGLPVGGGVEEPHVWDRYRFHHKLKIHFHPLTMRYYGLKGRMLYGKRFFDLGAVGDLPPKFVYFPLQYSPETSINIPAPLFIDQLRAVDLTLCGLPPDYYLVVKEHPAMVGERSGAFYAALKERAGLLLADFSVPSVEIIKRASLTVSVTGTSCLEAFLLAKPSLHIGRAYFTQWIYKFDCLSDFKEVVRQSIDAGEVPHERIIDLVSRVFEIGDNFVLFNPGDPARRIELLMNETNLDRFLSALMRHAGLRLIN